MDIHPSKEMVASAQKAGRTRKTQAHIRIWSPETLYTLYIVGNGEFEEGVSALAFSQLVCCYVFRITSIRRLPKGLGFGCKIKS